MLSCCAHKSDFHHNSCMQTLSCCAHKFDFHHNLCILIFSCCAHKFGSLHNLCTLILFDWAHKSGFCHNLCIVIFVFRAYTWFNALTFCSCLSTLRNTLLSNYFFCLWNTQIIKSVCILCSFFSILISHQVHEKYHWSLKIKWIIQTSFMRKPSQWFIKMKIMMITIQRIQAG